MLALRSEGAARYFRRVFRADWRGGAWRVPVGLLLVTGVGGAGAVVLARRFQFDPGAASDMDDDPDRIGW